MITMYNIHFENHKDTLNHLERKLLKALSCISDAAGAKRIEISRINELFNRIRRLSREETNEILLKFKGQGLVESWTRFGIVLDPVKVRRVLDS